MSDSINPHPIDSTISHNCYFEGKVQSLGLDTDKGKATVGVMKKGTYRFSTSSPEKMVIISGVANVRLPDGNWSKYTEQGQFNVAADTAFDVICDADVAYICFYG